ncbi:metallophosphoesterase, partial [Guyparkeria sp. 1SP6A2]|nr:metallophosphoesterase [Guyparkeria sp. 1SP6A2]
ALRQARIDAVKSVVGLARSHAVDFILIAGDTFEDNRIDHRYIREVSDVLRGSPVPVYIRPGNHDPLTQDSPFVLHESLFAPPVTVLRRAEPL